MTYLKNILLGILLMPFLALPSFANRGHKNGPCRADMEKFCGAHKGDRKAMKACVKENADKFSAECKAQKEKFKANKGKRQERMAKMLETCAADVQKLCPNANTAGAKKYAPMKCLMQNRDKVSATCKAALPEKRVKKQK